MHKSIVLIAILFVVLAGVQCGFGQCYTLPSPDNNEMRIFAQDVCGGVDNNPPNPTIFTIDSPRTITKIGTYHWNSGQGTQTPGTIGLQDQSGKTYGPWKASGQPGQGGVPNACWIVTLTTGLSLPAGTYKVIDSDPSTWAYNSESGNSGVVSVVGLNVGSFEVTQAPCGKEATDLSIASPTDQYRAGPILVTGSYKVWYGKRTGTHIGQPDNWNTKPVELLGGKFYVFDLSTGDFSSTNPQKVNPLLSNPTPDKSFVWYKASTQYAYVVCFDGPLNSTDGAVQESNDFNWTVVDDPSPSEPSQWVVQNSTIKQLSNIYRTDREYEFYQGTHTVAGSLDWTDYILSFDMKSADNDGIGAIVRYLDKNNYYRFIMVQDSGNHGPFRHLEKFVNGVRTVLAEDKNGYSPGQVYRMQFKALGNELEVWMDGSKILSATDDTFRSGKIGFLSYASQDMEITNVKVVDQYGQPLTGAPSAQSAQECAQSCKVCDTPPCLYCSGHLGDIAPAQSDLIYEVYSPVSTSMNPPAANTFTLDTERIITCIATYHWPGYTPGTIGLLSSLGDQLGPWQAEGRPGMDGRPNCVWVAYINQLLEPGTYAIIDSSQSTWSYVPSDCTSSKGICQVFAARLQETSPEKSVQGGCHKDPMTGEVICIDTIENISGKQGNAEGHTGSVSGQTGISPGHNESESAPVMIGSDQIKLPDRSSLIETSDWGEVPANQVMVMLKEGKGPKDADRLASDMRGQVVGFFSYINLYQIETSGTTEAELKDSVAKAKQDPDVKLAFPNQQSYPDATVQGKECSPLDDPVYTEGGRGKGYEMIGVQNAWDLIRVSGLSLFNVHVGVVDDGLYKGGDEYNGKAKIDTSTQGSELQNSLGKVYDNQGNLEHDFTVVGSHGTGVMNIISANPDNGGIAGIASEPLGDKLKTSMINYNAPPYGSNPESMPDPNDPTKVAWANGKTYAFGDLLAINKSITDGARIISCSWGNRSADPDMAAAYKQFFEKMANDHPDVLFVCSAGNDGIAPDGATSFPGGLALPNMVTVGNVMNDGTRATSSNVDNGNSYEVTLAAPGEQAVYGFDNKGGIDNNWGGTSMATPQVTSTAALLRALNPGLTASQIKDILAQTARTSIDIDGKKVPAPSKLGAGILAIDQAVFKVINDQRIKMHLDPFKDIESALKLARVDLTAKNDPSFPNDWKVTAQILALDAKAKGADVILDLQGEGAVGGNKRQHLTSSGSLTWDITLKDTATVVVKRLDTNGCCSVYLAGIGEDKRRISGCVNTGCGAIENWLVGGCNNHSAPGVEVDLTFNYIPSEYAKDTPSSMTTTTDDKGHFHFEVPPGSQYKIIVKGKEYDPKVYTGDNSAGSVCININPTKKLVLPAKAA